MSIYSLFLNTAIHYIHLLPFLSVGRMSTVQREVPSSETDLPTALPNVKGTSSVSSYLGWSKKGFIKLETACARWYYIPVWQNKAIFASVFNMEYILSLYSFSSDMAPDHIKNGVLKHA